LDDDLWRCCSQSFPAWGVVLFIRVTMSDTINPLNIEQAVNPTYFKKNALMVINSNVKTVKKNRAQV
jgi:hypothetical protein